MSTADLAQVGSVVVTCPACGTALEAPVIVQAVSLARQLSAYAYVDVTFSNVAVEHKCEGRT